MESVASVSWEDAEQIIRTHLWNKFDKWDQSKPFAPWCNRVIDRQVINIKKHLLGRFMSPCANCPFNLGDNLCSKTLSGKKSEECPEFKNWEKKKKPGFQIITARSIDETFEDDEDPRYQPAGGEVDIPGATAKLHKLMIDSLEGRLKKFYRLKYIEGQGDELISFAFGFMTTEEGRAPGYRQMYNMEAEIRKKVHHILETQDIF